MKIIDFVILLIYILPPRAFHFSVVPAHDLWTRFVSRSVYSQVPWRQEHCFPDASTLDLLLPDSPTICLGGGTLWYLEWAGKLRKINVMR